MPTRVDDRSDRRFALVTAGHHFLLRVVPLRQPDSSHALEQFMGVAEKIQLSPADVDAVLLACLKVLDRHVRRLPGLVVRYLDLRTVSVSIGPLRRFADCIAEALRYQAVGDPVVQRAIAIIEDRYADARLSTRAVAQQVDCSSSQLSVSFKRETGLHLKEYMREVRLMHAAKVLANATKRIKEVWTAVGYNHASNFDHDFKRRFGVTPSGYRASVIQPWMVEEEAAQFGTDAQRQAPASGNTVLIVDDDEGTRAAYGRYLTLEGHKVATATDASDALRQIGQVAPDVILLDQRLPGMDGLTCLRSLRQRRASFSPAVALLTADWDVFDYEDEARALYALIVSKLCGLEEVAGVVNYLGGMAHTPPTL